MRIKLQKSNCAVRRYSKTPNKGTRSRETRDGIEGFSSEGSTMRGISGISRGRRDGTRRVREESVLRYSGCSRRRRTPSHRRQTFRLQRNNKRAFPTDLPLPMSFGFRVEFTNDAECKYETRVLQADRGSRISLLRDLSRDWPAAKSHCPSRVILD